MTDLDLVAFAVLGFLVGAYGTIIGAGGGFLFVPLLLWIWGFPPEIAVGTSLFAVCVNAISGTLVYAGQRRIDYRSAVLFLMASIPGAIGGAWVPRELSGRAVNLIFGGLLACLSAWLMLRPERHPATPTDPLAPTVNGVGAEGATPDPGAAARPDAAGARAQGGDPAGTANAGASPSASCAASAVATPLPDPLGPEGAGPSPSASSTGPAAVPTCSPVADADLPTPLLPMGASTRVLVDAQGVRYEWSFDERDGMLLSFGLGFVSSVLGIGGGIIHVPAMTHLFHFPAHLATATSHLILAGTALVGASTHAALGQVAWTPALLLGLGAIGGAQLGGRLSPRVSGRGVIRGLAVGLVLLAARLLWAGVAA